VPVSIGTSPPSPPPPTPLQSTGTNVCSTFIGHATFCSFPWGLCRRRVHKSHNESYRQHFHEANLCMMDWLNLTGEASDSCAWMHTYRNLTVHWQWSIRTEYSVNHFMVYAFWSAPFKRTAFFINEVIGRQHLLKYLSWFSYIVYSTITTCYFNKYLFKYKEFLFHPCLYGTN
jgi:hypothetical protein